MCLSAYPWAVCLYCSVPQFFCLTFSHPKLFQVLFCVLQGHSFLFSVPQASPHLYLSMPPESSISLSSPGGFLCFPFVAQQCSAFTLLSPLILLFPFCASRTSLFNFQQTALKSWGTPLLPSSWYACCGSIGDKLGPITGEPWASVGVPKAGLRALWQLPGPIRGWEEGRGKGRCSRRAISHTTLGPAVC